MVPSLSPISGDIPLLFHTASPAGGLLLKSALRHTNTFLSVDPEYDVEIYLTKCDENPQRESTEISPTRNESSKKTPNNIETKENENLLSPKSVRWPSVKLRKSSPPHSMGNSGEETNEETDTQKTGLQKSPRSQSVSSPQWVDLPKDVDEEVSKRITRMPTLEEEDGRVGEQDHTPAGSPMEEDMVKTKSGKTEAPNLFKTKSLTRTGGFLSARQYPTSPPRTLHQQKEEKGEKQEIFMRQDAKQFFVSNNDKSARNYMKRSKSLVEGTNRVDVSAIISPPNSIRPWSVNLSGTLPVSTAKQTKRKSLLFQNVLDIKLENDPKTPSPRTKKPKKDSTSLSLGSSRKKYNSGEVDKEKGRKRSLFSPRKTKSKNKIGNQVMAVFSPKKTQLVNLFSKATVALMQTTYKIIDDGCNSAKVCGVYRDTLYNNAKLVLEAMRQMTDIFPSTNTLVEQHPLFFQISSRIVQELEIQKPSEDLKIEIAEQDLELTKMRLLDSIILHAKKLFYGGTHLLSIFQSMGIETVSCCYWMLGIIDQYTKIVKDLLHHVDWYQSLLLWKSKKTKSRSTSKSKSGIGRRSLNKRNNAWKDKETDIQNDRNGPSDPYRPGTLNHLVGRLLNCTEEYYKVFVHSSSQFSKPEEIWAKLMEFYVDDGREAENRKICVTTIINEWTRQEGHCFVPNLLNDIETFAKDMLQKEEKSFTVANNIIREIQQCKKKRYSQEYTSCPIYFPVYCTVGMPPHRLITLFSAEDIARHLTAIDLEFYKKIEPRELVGLKWMKESTSIFSPNVTALMHRNEHLSRWVATAILSQEPDLRSEVLAKFISVAQCLLSIQNYHSLMGIVSSLNLASVSRLHIAFNGLSKKSQEQFRTFNQICQPNFKFLREAMEKDTTVPYLGVCLSDIIHLEEALLDVVAVDSSSSPSSSGTKLINFTKHKKIYDRILSLLAPQSSTFSVETMEPLYTFLFILPTALNSRELHKLSLEMDPPTNPQQLVMPVGTSLNDTPEKSSSGCG